MELVMSAKILFFSFLALSRYAYVTSLRIREDYCESYCGTCKNRTCSVSSNTLTTDDYTINVVFLVLKFTWTNPVFQQWNIYEVSNESSQIVRVDVLGIPSADDVRFRPGKFYLRKLGVKDIEGFDVESPSLKIEEREITYANGPESLTLRYLAENSVNSKVTSDYIRASENNLKQIVLVSPIPSKQLSVQIGDLTFEGKTQLTFLEFAGFKVENLNAKTFDEMPSLERLVLNYVTLKDLSFSESKVLRQTLRHIIIRVADSVDMRYFGGFSRLEIIEVDSYIPFKNLTAFICREWICEFQFGTNGIACPSRCSCQYYRYESDPEFVIDCSQRYLYRVPPLPVPIAGKTVLLLQETYLIELPENSLAGYNNVKKLNVSHNELSSLSTDRLPTDLEELDISYNQISTLDPEVVEFIENLNLFWQVGNQWTFYCGEPNLLIFEARSIRIKAEQLHSIMEMLYVSKGVFLKNLFSLSSDNLYYEADEYSLITSLGSGSNYLSLKTLEELHRGIFLYSGEYEPIIIRELNAPCPYRCSCCLERESGQFIINCRDMYLDFYPILPNFIQYNTTLLLDGNEIARLSEPPFANMPGLASIQKLHVSNNVLIEFPHHLIPENITYMDLRNNSLKTLDDVFVDFMRYHEGILKVELSGNPWECDCTAKSFLSFLRAREPGEYVAALNRRGALSGECPDACICCLDNNSKELIIDCSRKGLRQIPPLPTLKDAQTTLYFEGNSLQELPPIFLPGFSSVTRLHLAHNQLTNIAELPENLTYLDVRDNGISVLSDGIREFFEKRINSSQLELFLSANPWTCSCEQIDFLEFVKGQAKYIVDTSSVVCADSGQPLIEVEEADICPSAFIYYASLAASLLVVASSINVFICFRQPILIWFYEHEVCLSLAARRDLDQDKRYDAFLAFTHKDEELVEEFVERLEKGKHRFRLCFYLRDWMVGESIPECISQSVKDSRRIIILMTNNFLKSTWGRLEFRLALHATSKDRCKRLIVVLYPDVENFDDLDSELRTYMVLNTYLERNNPNFWNKLIYSMPHS